MQRTEDAEEKGLFSHHFLVAFVLRMLLLDWQWCYLDP